MYTVHTVKAKPHKEQRPIQSIHVVLSRSDLQEVTNVSRFVWGVCHLPLMRDDLHSFHSTYNTPRIHYATHKNTDKI